MYPSIELFFTIALDTSGHLLLDVPMIRHPDHLCLFFFSFIFS